MIHPDQLEKPDVGTTSLIDALKFNSLIGVRYWVDKDPSQINIKNAFNYYPMHYAAAKGNPEFVKILHEHGANIGVRNMMKDTPLNMALMMGNKDTAHYLIRNGSPLDGPGNPAIIIAAERDYPETIALILAEGGNVNAVNSNGYTALHYACNKGHLSIAQFLLSYGANIEAGDFQTNSTPIFQAIFHNRYHLVRMLIHKGVYINHINDYGMTPLHIAAQEDCIDIVLILITKGALINARDNDGNTPLHLAGIFNNKEVFNLLTFRGADPNIINNMGHLPHMPQ